MLKKIITLLLVIAVLCSVSVIALADGETEDGYVEDSGEILISPAPDHSSDASRGASGNQALRIAIVVLVPCIIAAIVCGIFYSQMKTARIKNEANDYISETGLKLTARSDNFVNRTQERIYDPQQPRQGGGQTH